ncbi:MAG: hypothetical protein KC492_25255 [Myxococcales bacterium]|nr:hypothetical protein [Myxococcales bacterium]
MSWDGKSGLNKTVSERSLAVREMRADELRHAEAQRERNELMDKNQPQSVMGHRRVDLRAAEHAQQQWGQLNAKLDEALDVIAQAMERQRVAGPSHGLSADDLRRSPSLAQRFGGGAS